MLFLDKTPLCFKATYLSQPYANEVNLLNQPAGFEALLSAFHVLGLFVSPCFFLNQGKCF